MPTDYRESYVECDNCGARKDLPSPDAHYSVSRQALIDQGWSVRPNYAERPLKMLPHTYLWACPDCPPVN